MKSFLIVFTICLAIMTVIASASAEMVAPVESADLEPALHRMKRKNCDYNACRRLCRRLKFPGGACVNNRCKCDNF